MDTDTFPPDEEYDRQCGDIFLTVKGILIIHCSLCEERFKGFDKYAEHIQEQHVVSYYEKCETEIEDFSKYVEYVPEQDSENDKRNNFTEDEYNLQDNAIINFTESDVVMEGNVEYCSSEEQIKESVGEVNHSINVECNSNCQRKVLKDKPKATCPHCGYETLSKSNLLVHIRRHSNEKNHACTYCPKKFYTTTELKLHVSTHTGDKRFQCNICELKVSTRYKLSVHIQRHKKQCEKQCTICGLKFVTNQELSNHLAVHNNIRPFKCAICSDSFKLAVSLSSHMKKHENKLNHRCHLCSARFNHKCNLTSHLLKRHGGIVTK